jgi:hypothetical protein
MNDFFSFFTRTMKRTQKIVFIATHCPEVIHIQNYEKTIILCGVGRRFKGKWWEPLKFAHSNRPES